MPYQLLLRNHTEHVLSELFARGKCLNFQEAPFAVGAADGLPDGYRLEFIEAGGALQLRNTGAAFVKLGDSVVSAGETHDIQHGAILVLGEKELRFYRLHGRPGVSWSANAVGLLAIFGVALSLIIEVAAFSGLGHYLRHSSGIQSQKESQELSARVDAVRKRLQSKELAQTVAADQVSAAYLEALREELERRVAFLRRNGEELTSAERREHLDNLARMEEFLTRFSENPSVTPAMPDVQIDGPVRNLIEEK
ncbi:MAG: hypothetical protein MJ106_02410 [Lentisphaeria bacterium]|nr:hypothetical protein [Lentisphaeria bacterium]